MDLTPKTINIATNVIGCLLFILEPVNSYLSSQPFNWKTFTVCILSAILAYCTGKGSLSVLKTSVQLPKGVTNDPTTPSK